MSEQAAIVARYADLFTRDSSGRCARPRTARRSGRARAPLPPAQGVRGRHPGPSSPSARTRSRTRSSPHASRSRGEEIPLRTAQARLAVLDGYGDRDELGRIHAEALGRRSTTSGSSCSRAGEDLEADLTGEPDPVARNEEEKGISLGELEAALARGERRRLRRVDELRERWFERAARPGARRRADVGHVAYVRRLSPLEAIYTKERSVEVCMATLEGSASGSTSSRTSGSTSTIVRRSRRAPA